MDPATGLETASIRTVKFPAFGGKEYGVAQEAALDEQDDRVVDGDAEDEHRAGPHDQRRQVDDAREHDQRGVQVYHPVSVPQHRIQRDPRDAHQDVRNGEVNHQVLQEKYYSYMK